MALSTQEIEEEIFAKVLSAAARLVVEHKKEGLPPSLRPGELEEIYRQYADVTDLPLFERFGKYLMTPAGRDFFLKTIRSEFWKAGFRPKGWEK